MTGSLHSISIMSYARDARKLGPCVFGTWNGMPEEALKEYVMPSEAGEILGVLFPYIPTGANRSEYRERIETRYISVDSFVAVGASTYQFIFKE